MIKACLFDLDGTLLDTLTTIAYYGNYALDKHGFETAEVSCYKNFAGNGAVKLCERMLKFSNSYSQESFDKVYRCYMDAYDANPTYLTKPYDGIVEMLASLKQKGIKVGVISNKPDFAARSVVNAVLPKKLVDDVQGQIDGIPVKPDISGPMQVLSRMGVKPCETAFIGDSGVDMQTGKNMGSFSVGVSWGFRSADELTENGADCIVSQPMEIIKVLDEADF